MSRNFVSKNRAVYTYEKMCNNYGRARQAKDDKYNAAHALAMLDT